MVRPSRLTGNDRRMVPAPAAAWLTASVLMVVALAAFAPTSSASESVLPSLRILAPLGDVSAARTLHRVPTVPSPRWSASACRGPVCCGAVDAAAAWRSLDLPPPTIA